MKNENLKKSRDKIKNGLEEKRKNGQAKNLHKTNTFGVIAMNFFQEQLKKTNMFTIIALNFV